MNKFLKYIDIFNYKIDTNSVKYLFLYVFHCFSVFFQKLFFLMFPPMLIGLWLFSHTRILDLQVGENANQKSLHLPNFKRRSGKERKRKPKPSSIRILPTWETRLR